MEKKVEEPSTSSGKRNKVPPPLERSHFGLANLILKKLNSTAYPQKLPWLKGQYEDLLREHEGCDISMTTLEKCHAALKATVAELEQDNEKQLVALERLDGLCKVLCSRNKVMTVENIRQDEEKRQSAINEATKRMQESLSKSSNFLEDKVTLSNTVSNLYSKFKSYQEEKLWINKQINYERQLVASKVANATSELHSKSALIENERTALNEKLREGENSCACSQSLIDELHRKIQECIECRVTYKTVTRSRKHLIQMYKHKKDRLKQKIRSLNKQVMLWQKQSNKNILKTVDLQLLYEGKDIQLAESLKHLESLQNAHQHLLEDKSKCLALFKVNALNPALEIKVLKTELPVYQKELLCKPVKWRLCRTRADCFTEKDQNTLMVLLHLLKYSKSQRDISNTIHLCLGFINFKLTYKRQGRLEQVFSHYVPENKTTLDYDQPTCSRRYSPTED